MAALPHWPPEDEMALKEWIIENRIMGKTWHKLAVMLKIGERTLYDYLEKNPQIRSEINERVDVGQIEALRQTGMELAIDKKDRQLLQFMLKAKAKMFDVPVPVEEKPKHETISQETAKQILEELRGKSS